MLPWLKIPPLTGSPTRIVKREEVLAIFDRIAKTPLSVSGGSARETPDGIAITPYPEATPSFTPGLRVAYVGEIGAAPRLSVAPCRVRGIMPTIGGVALDHDPAPLLTYHGPGEIVVTFQVTANITDVFRPVGNVLGGVEVGYRSEFPEVVPVMGWDSNIHDSDPPDPAADNPSPPSVKTGRWTFPIAAILKDGTIRQYLEVPESPAAFSPALATSNW